LQCRKTFVRQFLGSNLGFLQEVNPPKTAPSKIKLLNCWT